MAGLKLPRLKANLAIVSNRGTPLDYFLRFWNIEVAPRIEKQEASQDETIANIQELLLQIQSANQIAQQAQAAANEAQATADAAAGDAAVSGSATDPAIDVPDFEWVAGPSVTLTGVAPGVLTLTGSGPQQDSDVTISAINDSTSCSWRVVEIVGGVEEVVFSGAFSISNLRPGAATVSNTSARAVQSFSSNRTNSGSVTYRIDARGTPKFEITSLLLYVFARRA